MGRGIGGGRDQATLRRLVQAAATASALALALSACGAEGPTDRAASTVTDSAGVWIVTSAKPSAPGSISVDAEPSNVIGSLEGPPEDNLSRVWDATVLADGRIALLNSDAAEVQLRSADGAHLQTLGRRGGGPGEFQIPRWVQVIGDTLAVYDPFQSNGRLTLYSLDGELLEVVRPEVDGLAYPDPNAILADGSFFDERSEPSIEWPETGYTAYTRYPIRFPRTGERIDTLTKAPGTERFSEADGNARLAWDIPFGREAQTAVAGERIYLSDGSRAVVDGHSFDRGHVISIRLKVDPTPVTPEDVARWIDVRLSNPLYERRPDAAGRARAQYQETPSAERMPIHQEMVADATARLWVRRYTPPWEPSNSWWVFGEDGIWLDTVELPLGVEVFEIGERQLLGHRTDELGVEYVVVHDVSSAQPLDPMR